MLNDLPLSLDYHDLGEPNELLEAVWEYLFERNVPVENFNIDRWHRSGYIQVNRKRHIMVLTIDGASVEVVTQVQVGKVGGSFSVSHGRVIGALRFDLNAPNSLQAIYEHVMSKKRK